MVSLSHNFKMKSLQHSIYALYVCVLFLFGLLRIHFIWIFCVVISCLCMIFFCFCSVHLLETSSWFEFMNTFASEWSFFKLNILSELMTLAWRVRHSTCYYWISRSKSVYRVSTFDTEIPNHDGFVRLALLY